MRGATATGRGERLRVAARVRALLDAPGRAEDLAGYPGLEPRRADQVDAGGRGFVGEGVAGESAADRAAEDEAAEDEAAEEADEEADALALPRPRRYRFDPGRRGAAVVGAAVVVAAIITGLWVFSSRPQTMAVTGSAASSAAASSAALFSGALPAGPSGAASGTAGTAPVDPATGSAAPSGSGTGPGPADQLVVDVAGKVRHPGLYRLPPGSRVDDALRAAGGALPGVNLISLNLALKVSDGQQVVVGLPAGAGAAGASGGGPAGSAADGGSATASAPVNLNSATLEQLQTLPGIGPALGQRILDWRSAHGSFSSVNQLNEVSGIGDVRFAQLRPLVTI